MMCDLMKEWLQNFDKHMCLQGPEILLFLDNSISHPWDVHFNNMKFVFLPANIFIFSTAGPKPLR